jgi:hypothetical protein
MRRAGADDARNPRRGADSDVATFEQAGLDTGKVFEAEKAFGLNTGDDETDLICMGRDDQMQRIRRAGSCGDQVAKRIDRHRIHEWREAITKPPDHGSFVA